MRENKKEIKILAVGDSLTKGYGLRLDQSYPKQLENKLLENNYKVNVINAGINGETTWGLIRRLGSFKKLKPDMVLITIGGNDSFGVSPLLDIENNLRNIIQEFKKYLEPSKIFLMQIRTFPHAGIAYSLKFKSLYKKIAKQEKINLVPFVLYKVFLNKKFLLRDRIHPNKDGVKIIVDNHVYKAVKKELEK